jgi:TetR/AcrR family transcriptional regulator, cholesterol catabolism regulator
MDVNERIQVKAHELFMQFGIRSVSMDDIASHLGMSKKTIYQYFADKDELVDAVIQAEIQDMQSDCMDFRKEAKDAVHEIFMTMEGIVEQLRHVNPVVIYDLEKFHFEAYQKFKAHKDKFLIKVIRENLEWGVREELYRPEINIDIIAQFRVESIMMGFNISALPLGKYNLADVTREILTHFVYGIASAKGVKLIQKYNQQKQ